MQKSFKKICLAYKFLVTYLLLISVLSTGCAPKELVRARDLFNQASVYRINGQDDQAEQLYKEALTTFQQVVAKETKDPQNPGNLQVISQAYSLIAFAQIELEQFTEAEDTIREGSSFMLNANPRERELLFILGGILQTAQAAKLNKKGRFQQDVVDLYQEAAATFKALADVPGVEQDSDVLVYAREAEAISYGNIAAEYVTDFAINKGTGSLDRAIEYLQKARETCEQLLAIESNKDRPYTQYLLGQYTRELELAKKKREGLS
jgi:tetratricopeptide (TPR) repeat protein